MQLTKNFHLSEFKCNDGTKVPEELIPKVKELAENLQVLRDYIKEPIFLNSAYRTKEYNTLIGGTANSQHVKGCAADITCKSKSPKQLANIIEVLIEEGKMKQGGVGRYNGFTHYDIRGTKARWNFTK